MSNPRVYRADEDELIERLDEDGVQALEEAYGVDLTEGAYVVEFAAKGRASLRDIRWALSRPMDEEYPLIIISKDGFTMGAASLAMEYEDVLLCAREHGAWVPWEVHA